jgi:hypothetical protein
MNTVCDYKYSNEFDQSVSPLSKVGFNISIPPQGEYTFIRYIAFPVETGRLNERNSSK